MNRESPFIAESGPVRLLVVDDDAMIRQLMKVILEKHRANVCLACNAQEARQTIEKLGTTAFDVVISDYMMPGETGLGLISWLQTKDPCLSTLIITAQKDEKNLATQTLRSGGLDFLEKPIDTALLLSAVKKAMYRTRHQRDLIDTNSQVKSVAEIQDDLMERQLRQYPGRFEVFYHPQHEIGGDFLRVFSEGDRKFEVLIGDVSGHDIRASFISVYFQGIVRGMQEQGASRQRVFQYFNSFLIHEWSDQETAFPRVTSISACSMRVDLDNKTLVMLDCGSPTPIAMTTSGFIRTVGNIGGHPLGWFDDYGTQEIHDSIEHDTYLFVWTDGVDELAHQKQLNIVTVLFLLLHRRQAFYDASKKTGMTVDDILAVRIWIQNASSQEDGYWPFYSDKYSREQSAQIDQFQASWTRSLIEVFQGINPDCFYDILLASREAVLNALTHGCQSPSSNSMVFQMSCHLGKSMVRVRIIDDGPGHDFDWDFHDHQTDLKDCHRGLELIKKLPQSIRTERQGATVIMDFQLNALNP